MGKKILIVVFSLTLAYATFLFINRDTRFLREKITRDQVKTPRVVLEDFKVFRYHDKDIKAQVSARLGHFFEPNLVELNGDIRGLRHTERGPETIGAEAVMAYFEADDIGSMLKEAPLQLAELTGFVEVGVRDHLLTTDYAEYKAADKVVASTRPVRVEGPGRVFTGEDGFNYDLDSQSLDILGHVEGIVRSQRK